MIFYRNRGHRSLWHIIQREGSVFPSAFKVALPIATVSCLLEFLQQHDLIKFSTEAHGTIVNESAVWGGFTFLVGFLIVFRTNIAYSRFWDGVTSTHKMRAEWFDACASIVAFTKFSEADASAVEDFQNSLVRLFSVLHAVALAEIEDSNSDEVKDIRAFSLDLMDIGAMDSESLLSIKNSECKPELLFQWIQQFIVENIKNGVLSIPPPILSRAFQELANGMVEFHEALKVSSIPFPFPYAQVCDFLLLVHMIVTPIIITQWVNDIWWVFLFCFLQIFIMWSLKAIAVELENPFGADANDLDQGMMQKEMNTHLELLVSPATLRTPTKSKGSAPEPSINRTGSMEGRRQQKSLATMWRIAGKSLDKSKSSTALSTLPARSIRSATGRFSVHGSLSKSQTQRLSGVATGRSSDEEDDDTAQLEVLANSRANAGVSTMGNAAYGSSNEEQYTETTIKVGRIGTKKKKKKTAREDDFKTPFGEDFEPETVSDTDRSAPTGSASSPARRVSFKDRINGASLHSFEPDRPESSGSAARSGQETITQPYSDQWMDRGDGPVSSFPHDDML